MNKVGSGVTHINLFHNDEMKTFTGGLRASTNIIFENNSSKAYTHHDKLSYERGTIIHSRSPATQYMNFHYMYGGIRTFFVQRYLYQQVYKRVLRPAVPVALFWFTCKIKSPMLGNETL